jgi:hypothetical protein
VGEPIIPGGCILIARKIVESEIWDKPPLYIKVWIYLLARAQHSDFKKMKRGQLRVSIPEIIDACCWRVGARIERPKKDQIYQIINWLRNPNNNSDNEAERSKTQRSPLESNAKATMITTMKATQGLLVTIDNYGFYQTFTNYESNDESNDEKATKPARKQRRPDNTNKNGKNDKNDLKELSTEILNFRSRYSESQIQYIESYLDLIRFTRVKKDVSDSVLLKIYNYFHRFPAEKVEYAVRTHLDNEKLHKTKEEYTFGILRNATDTDIQRKLNKGNGPKKESEMTPEEYKAYIEEAKKEME